MADDDAPTDQFTIPVTAAEEPAAAGGGSSRRAVVITKVAAAAVVVAAVAVAVLAPSGEPVRYDVTAGHPSSASSTGPLKVPKATLPGGVAAAPPGAGAPAPTGGVPNSIPLGGNAGGPASSPGGPPAVGAPVPVGPSGTGPGSTSPGATSPGAPVPGAPNSTTPGALGGGTFGTDQPPPQKRCSVGWPQPGPGQQGGLQSLIGIAPFFGPFSSEAFALGSVFQGVLQLAGPILAEIEPVITANNSWISPLIPRVQAMEAVVLQAILPFYGPYRQQFLDAEVAISRQLTPILTRFYSSDLASCLVSWQAQIINRAKGKPITVASLSRPGQLITLGPRR